MRDWIRDYCTQKSGVEEEFKVAWNSTLYRIGGKIFVMLGEYKDGRPLLTAKLEPLFSEILRAQYPGDIIPGYYTDKNHWSSLFMESSVPDDTVRAMLDNAYEITFRGLTRKAQALILDQAPDFFYKISRVIFINNHIKTHSKYDFITFTRPDYALLLYLV